jgi:hypothetical protein
MKLPEAVRRQGEVSDQLLEQWRKERDQEGQPQGEQPAPDNAPTQPQDTAPTDGSAPQPHATNEPAPSVEPPKDRTDWKAKYHVLDGKYRAEVPRMAEEIRGLKAEVRELREKQQTAPQVTPPAMADDYRQKFDPELVEMIERLAEQKAKQMVEPVTASVAKSSFDVFVDRVRSHVGNLDAIDSDPDFVGFMAQRDSFSGRSRQELLEDAVRAQDSERVVAFYDAFKSTVQGANPPPGVTTQTPPPAPPAAAVVPSQSGSPGAPAAAKVYTGGEIAAFYSAVTKGHYRGREALVNQIEADIRQAHMEGRVR